MCWLKCARVKYHLPFDRSNFVFFIFYFEDSMFSEQLNGE